MWDNRLSSIWMSAEVMWVICRLSAIEFWGAVYVVS